MSELVELLNEYGHAKFGDEWWPGNASAWIGADKAERLEKLAREEDAKARLSERGAICRVRQLITKKGKTR